MYVDSLHLKCFRNFLDERFDFSNKFNIFIGLNAQGKTNILEAIAFLSNGKSFRTSENADAINWAATSARICGGAAQKDRRDELTLSIDGEGKRFKRNGKNARPSGLRCVLFAPEEILLLKGPPSDRRRYLDTFSTGFSNAHKKFSAEYSKIVSQRNALLQDERLVGKKKLEALEPWDVRIAKQGAILTESRAKWVDELNRVLPLCYRAIAPEDGVASFVYMPNCGEEVTRAGTVEIEKWLMKKLSERRWDEFTRGMTLSGPHRDDLVARIDGREVQSFGSQGQHRSFVLALKVAEMELHRQICGKAPLLLLDDVMSELDRERNRRFFEYLSSLEAQVFITATSDNGAFDSIKNGVKRFKIDMGRSAPAT